MIACKQNSQQKDHPRLCGEKTLTVPNVPGSEGSPPPMRGKARITPLFPHLQRITPAYAGKSIPFVTRKTARRDHPRLCGEKKGLHIYTPSQRGSPPPMRGKVNPSAGFKAPYRITPAYAGKRCNRSHIKHSQKGSPPPMRGKASRRFPVGRFFGITPAYAGKSGINRYSTTF